MAKPGVRLEIWGLVALFSVFLASSFYFEQVAQETGALEEPSSLAAQPVGVKALYQFYQDARAQGSSLPEYRVDRLRQPWNRLTSDQGLVLIIEPQSRPPSEQEIPALQRWVEEGGAVLYIVSKRSSSVMEDEETKKKLAEADTLTGDADVIPLKNETGGARTVAPIATDSPYTRDVAFLSVSSPVRLKVSPKSAYQILFRDADGVIAVHKTVGKGHVLLVANDQLASNSGIANQDNVIFLDNVAQAAVGTTHRQIVFDEYHHGVGFEHQQGDKTAGLLASMPVPLRLCLWHLAGLSALILYNGNRRFGKPRSAATAQYRLRADFVHSMGLLLRRAGAADVALLTLYQSFVRELRRSFDLAPEATTDEIAAQALRRRYTRSEELRQLLYRCEEIAAGARIQETEMLTLTRKIDHFRRDFDLVGLK